MQLFTQLENRNKINVYQPNRCSTYILRSQFVLDQEIDDYYIDRHNRLYPIFNNTIFALREKYYKLIENICDYKIIDTEYGVLFYCIIKIKAEIPINNNQLLEPIAQAEERKFERELKSNNSNTELMSIEDNPQLSNKKTVIELEKLKTEKFYYKLVSREVKDEIENTTELLILDHKNYKILVLNRKNYFVYDDKNIYIEFKQKSHKIRIESTIKDLCYLEDKLVILDINSNIQIFDLNELRMTSGFKTIAPASAILSQVELGLVAINSTEGIFVIDVKHRNIIKKKSKSELHFDYDKIIFADKRTLLLIGKGVWEWCLADGSIYAVLDPSVNCTYKHFEESQGYILNPEYKNSSKEDKYDCNCFHNLLNLKVEMRRELHLLNREVEELKEKIKKLEERGM